MYFWAPRDSFLFVYIQQGMFTLEFSSCLLEIPNDIYMLLNQILIGCSLPSLWHRSCLALLSVIPCTLLIHRDVAYAFLVDWKHQVSVFYHVILQLTFYLLSSVCQDHFLFDKPVSPLLLASGMARDWPDGRGIWHNDAKTFLVWINEEDHTRLISMQKGGNIAQVFQRFCQGLNLVSYIQSVSYIYTSIDKYIKKCVMTIIGCELH